MKEWFFQKTANEQKIIAIGIFLLSLLFAYAFLYLPITRDNSTLEKRINKQEKNLVVMKNMAKKVKQLSNRKSPGATDSTQIMTLIERTAKQQRLKITQIRPLSKQRLLITLDKTLFNNSIRWLNNLQKNSAIAVDRFSAQQNKDSINLQITLSY